MKTIFITIPEASSARNLLRGGFWPAFKKSGEFRIVLITTQAKKEQYTREFGGEHIEIESLAYEPPSFVERVLAFFSRNALGTGTTTFNQMRQYHDGGSMLALGAKRAVWLALGRSRLFQAMIRHIELARRPSARIAQLFNQYRPAGIFTTITIHPEIDVVLLREAKRRGIKTIGMLRGWDNLTTHGFLRVVPDRMVLQNQYLKDMAQKYHFLPEFMFEVGGFPQNDWYCRRDLIEPREEFLARIGIDPRKRVVLYGAMGDFLFPREGEIAEVFEEQVASGVLPSDLVMIFRAHPAFASPLERMKSMGHVVPDRDALYLAEGEVESWEMGEKEMRHLINSIVHSEMVITAGSTMALDAIALGKPAIAVAFEKTPISFWVSARRFRTHYTHFEALMVLGGVSAADTPEEFVKAVVRYLEHPEADEEGRERVRTQFLAPMEGDSGARIASAVLRHFNG